MGGSCKLHPVSTSPMKRFIHLCCLSFRFPNNEQNDGFLCLRVVVILMVNHAHDAVCPCHRTPSTFLRTLNKPRQKKLKQIFCITTGIDLCVHCPRFAWKPRHQNTHISSLQTPLLCHRCTLVRCQSPGQESARPSPSESQTNLFRLSPYVLQNLMNLLSFFSCDDSEFKKGAKNHLSPFFSFLIDFNTFLFDKQFIVNAKTQCQQIKYKTHRV